VETQTHTRMTEVAVPLSVSSLEDYRKFLKIKALPQYRFVGHTAYVPAEYAARLGANAEAGIDIPYEPRPFLYDYQRDIAALAIRKRKFAAFAQCGLGKSNIFFEFARHVDKCLPPQRAILIVSPLMVVDQTIAESRRFYGDELPWEYVAAKDLPAWLHNGGRFGITNYEAMRSDLEQGRLGCLIIDESSALKSHYGKWGTTILRLGRGLAWKFCATGTPAPNDRIEYANHAVFLDAFPNVNSFLARFFVNRGQTQNRWELKAHAVGPFYRALSHWCIFLENPSVYGWKDHATDIPPIHIHIHEVCLTEQQRGLIQNATGQLLVANVGGIGKRAELSGISKGQYKGRVIDTNKYTYIHALVDSWPDESTLIWCLYNEEQKRMEKEFPEAASIAGNTPLETRKRLLREFQAGTRKVMISKARVLGFGLNLQVATRQIFSGLVDSYESFFQAVKRSNRIGSTLPLNVHIPVTEAEWPMVETVLRKAHRVQQDSDEQEKIFRENLSQEIRSA